MGMMRLRLPTNSIRTEIREKNDPDLFECAQDEIVDVRRCSSESLSWSIECNSGACFINTNERIWFELFS